MHFRMYSAVLVVLIALAAWADSATAQSKKKIAVLGLEVIDAGGGIDAKTTQLANQITDALRRRPELQLGPYALAPHSKKDLLEMKLLSGCNNEAESCMARIGRDLKADVLMYGKIQRLTDGFQVTLTVLTVRSRQKKSTTAKLQASESRTNSRVTEWTRKLYNRITGVPERGILVVKANVDRGKVYVDGKIKGNLSKKTVRIKGLRTGTRQVSIEAPGHQTFNDEVRIRAGKSVSLNASLDAIALGPQSGPSDDTPKSGDSRRMWRIATWGAVAATAASGVGWVIEWRQIKGTQDDTEKIRDGLKMELKMMLEENNVCTGIDALAMSDTAFGELKSKCDAGKRHARNTQILVPLTFLAGAAAAVSYYFGYLSGDSSNRERARLRGKSDQPTVELVPSVTPSSVGGAVKIEF
ncbi:MAG: PEGA domain-containing protein [Proteobacteria bacterium]|nr:PEGA domain-containing protein [Pseudomonadota bacterium]